MSKKDKKQENIDSNQKVILKKEDFSISLKAYLSSKKISRYEWSPREVFALKHKKEKLTFQEWDDFFKKY